MSHNRHTCSCGETDPAKFYGRRKNSCARCHNAGVIRLAQEKKRQAIAHLGGGCKVCGFNKFREALDLHHLDPTKKDPTFKSWRGWCWDRLVRELEGCVLLCRNCHSGVHAGHISL